MKKSIFIRVLTLALAFHTSLFCFSQQMICSIEVIPDNPSVKDDILIITNVLFNFGSPGTCPPLSFYTLEFKVTTLDLNLYFDVSGVWPQYECNSIDSKAIGMLDTGNYTLKVILNHIWYQDTILSIDSAFYDFTVSGTANTNDSRVSELISFYPNPASDYVIFGIEPPLLAAYPLRDYPDNGIQIYNLMGQKVEEIQLKDPETIWNCTGVKPGVYFFKLNIGGKLSTGKVVVW